MFRRTATIRSTLDSVEPSTHRTRVGAPLEVVAEDEWLLVRVRQHSSLIGSIAGSVFLGACLSGSAIGALYAWTTHGWRSGVATLLCAFVAVSFLTVIAGAAKGAMRIGPPALRYNRLGGVCELPRQDVTLRGCMPRGVEVIRISLKEQTGEGTAWVRFDQLILLYTDADGQSRRALVCHSPLSLRHVGESLADAWGVPLTRRRVGPITFEQWARVHGPVSRLG